MPCLIMDKHPAELDFVPYSKTVELPDVFSNFVLTVNGNIFNSPHEFTINVVSNGNILFHMNPRWSEGRTVLNTMSKSSKWGQPEYGFFSTLTPNSKFSIVITYNGNGNLFKVKVNNEPEQLFAGRIAPSVTRREILIDKFEENDIELTLVQLNTA